jgi:hypothetical protein
MYCKTAVKNIVSIGSAGASDILSKSFLNIFETFGYDKIGLGCYLHNGVFQLMGVETTPEKGFMPLLQAAVCHDLM